MIRWSPCDTAVVRSFADFLRTDQDHADFLRTMIMVRRRSP
jgi:hypothetical protein